MANDKEWKMLSFFDLVERTVKESHSQTHALMYASNQLREILSSENEAELKSLLQEQSLTIVDSLNIGRWDDYYKVLHDHGVDPIIVEKLRHSAIGDGVSENFIKEYGELAENFDNPNTDPTFILENNITLCSLFQKLVPKCPQFLIVHRSDKFDFYSAEDDSGSVHYVIEINSKPFGIKSMVNEIDDAAVIIMYEFVKRFGSTQIDNLSIMSKDGYRWWKHPYHQVIFWRYGNDFEVKHSLCFNSTESFNCSDKSIARYGWA